MPAGESSRRASECQKSGGAGGTASCRGYRGSAPNPCAAALSPQTSVALFAGNGGQFWAFRQTDTGLEEKSPVFSYIVYIVQEREAQKRIAGASRGQRGNGSFFHPVSPACRLFPSFLLPQNVIYCYQEHFCYHERRMKPCLYPDTKASRPTC